MPYQQAPIDEGLRAACARALHVLRADGSTLRAGRAVLYILEHEGWGRAARALSYPPLVWFVELGYWIVARNRRLFSRFLFKHE